MDGKRVTHNMNIGPVLISLFPKESAIFVTTEETMFSFRAVCLGGDWHRHLDVSVSIKSSPQRQSRYLGVLGMTLNRAIGSSVPELFSGSTSLTHMQKELRESFEVDSFFPQVNDLTDQIF